MNQRSTFTLTILLLLPVLAFAQSGSMLTQTTQWNSSSGVELSSSDTVAAAIHFIVRGNDTVEMKNGNHVQTFTVTGTEGSWSNVAQHGTLTYNVTIYSQPGTLVFTREASGITVQLDMSTAETGGIRHTYFIDSIQPIH